MGPKVLRRLRVRLFPLCFFLILTFTLTACESLFRPIFQLIYFVLQLPFQIIRLVFSLLPFVIRYAPLALLFVEGKGDAVDEYYAYLSPGKTPVKLDENLYCFILDLREEGQAEALAHVAYQRQDPILFLKELDSFRSSENLKGIYQYLKESRMPLAYDSRLRLPLNDSKESFVRV